VSAVEANSEIALGTIDLSSASLDVGKRLNGKLILIPAVRDPSRSHSFTMFHHMHLIQRVCESHPTPHIPCYSATDDHVRFAHEHPALIESPRVLR
jgi:hypothetical protein